MNTAVIVCNGEFPKKEYPRYLIQSADLVICCDSARNVARLEALGRTPDLLVGDMDSTPVSVQKRLSGNSGSTAAPASASGPGRVVRIPEQDDNDLAKAFRFALSQGWRDLVILGATGRREDHTLGNIAWLADFAPLADSVEMITDYGLFRAYLPPMARFRAAPGMQVSIFSFDPSDPLTGTGLKFPVENLCLKRWWTAALNEAVADEITLSFATGPLIVFKTHA